MGGFIDQKNLGELLGRPVYSYENFKLLPGEKNVIVSLLNEEIRDNIIYTLKSDGIKYVLFSEIIENENDVISKNRMMVADYHNEAMDDYFENAENSIETFWSAKSVFKSMFDKLDTSEIVELACGRGRHVPHYINTASDIILVDILDKNINFCKERFKTEKKIKYYVNNGYDLAEIGDDSVTAIFSYDSVVHFEMLDIYSYLKEFRRILNVGGMALIHHSNNTESYKVSFETGRAGRNYMSKELFAYLGNRAGLEVIEQKVIDWGGYSDLDCVTLLRKNK